MRRLVGNTTAEVRKLQTASLSLRNGAVFDPARILLYTYQIDRWHSFYLDHPYCYVDHTLK